MSCQDGNLSNPLPVGEAMQGMDASCFSHNNCPLTSSPSSSNASCRDVLSPPFSPIRDSLSCSSCQDHSSDSEPTSPLQPSSSNQPPSAHQPIRKQAWQGLPAIRTRPATQPLRFNPPAPDTPTTTTSICRLPYHKYPSTSCSTTPRSSDALSSSPRLPICGASTASSTPRAAHNVPGALLTLPDQILLLIWEQLDACSRAALYHTCKTMWTNTALNSAITTCCCNSLDDLLTWPRNAALPTQLRVVNGRPGGPQPSRAWIDPGSHEETDAGDRSFVLLLDAARQHSRAVEVLSGVAHVVLQGRGKGSGVCKRLPWLLGPLCPNVSSLLIDWCTMSGEACAAASCWLPDLTHLTLMSVNSMELRGTWPQPLLTYSDLANLTGLTRLELVDCHLPFLELGVQDVTPLASLSHLRALHLVFSNKEYEWPGTKPCYLLLGLGEVSKACHQLEELVLDGVHHAKMVPPSWPALRCLALGCLSGWHPSLVTVLDLDKAAPRLRQLTLGQLRCSGSSLEAKLVFSSRILAAAACLAACPAPPAHIDLLVPPAFTEHVPLAQLLGSLRPLSHCLRSLRLEADSVLPGDGTALAGHLGSHLNRLDLCLRHTCCAGLAEMVEALPHVEHMRLSGCDGNIVDDANALSLCYAALSAPRAVPLMLIMSRVGPFMALCIHEMGQIKAASGQPVTFVTT